MKVETRCVALARLQTEFFNRTIARRALGFEMDIRYHTRHPVADVPRAHEPSLVELARWADFLVVITAGRAGTRHLINTEVLEALGPRSFLINVSRGLVVDESALIRALAEKLILVDAAADLSRGHIRAALVLHRACRAIGLACAVVHIAHHG